MTDLQVLPADCETSDPSRIPHVFCSCQLSAKPPIAMCGNPMPHGSFLPLGVQPEMACVVCVEIQHEACRRCGL